MTQPIIIIVLLILLLVVLSGMGYSIYSLVLLDAKSRGNKHPRFWSLLAAGGQNGGGLLLYLFSRRKTISLATSVEQEQIQRLKRKIYYLMALLFFLFLSFVTVLVYFN